MSRRHRQRRRYRRRISWRDGFVTLLFLAILTGIVMLLDGHDPKSFSGGHHVVDGDTIIVEGEKLRLTGIDAPELSQECRREEKPWLCGRASRNALRGYIRGKELSCKTTGLDRYDRWLAVCVAEGDEVNKWMVEAGWAVDYGGYGREEGMARRGRRGLWAGQFENPQEWRHANRGDVTETPQNGMAWIKRPIRWLKELVM